MKIETFTHTDEQFYYYGVIHDGRIKFVKLEPIIKHISLPIRPARLVRWVNNIEDSEALLGDLEEGFEYDVEKFGIGFAKRNYWKECLSIFFQAAKAWVIRNIPLLQSLDAVLQRFTRG